MSYRCQCGNLSKINLNNLLTGKRCKQCGIKKRSLSNAQSYSEIAEKCGRLSLILLTTPAEYLASLGANDSKHRRIFVQCGKGHVLHKTIANLERGENKHFACKTCWLEHNRGETHTNWIHGRSDEQRTHRRNNRILDTQWKVAVHIRDGGKCVICKSHAKQAHHLDGYHWCREKRLDVSNGVSLCKECHKEFHSLYGKSMNTQEQFEEFKGRKIPAVAHGGDSPVSPI